MLCHFLNRGIEPEKIINLPLSEKLFYKACYEVYMEDEYEKYKALTGGEQQGLPKNRRFSGKKEYHRNK